MIDGEEGLTVSGVAASAEEALRTESLKHADVVLMDLHLPGINGLQFMDALRRVGLSARVVIFTSARGDEDVFRAYEAGAIAYVVKTSPNEALIRAIRRAYANERHMPEDIALRFAARSPQNHLSGRELEILEHVTHGLTNREIGAILNISDKTVRNHVVNCLNKLRAKDRTEATAIALRRGLIAASDLT